jgi:hypothetical protein
MKQRRNIAVYFGAAATIVLASCLCGCSSKKPAAPTVAQAPASAPAPTTTEPRWTEVSTPSPAVDVTAVGNVFWICGADEMIASSSDGGNTWQTKHHTPNGKILLHIAFVNERVGHAAGKGGMLLSTTDGGKDWKVHNAGDDVLDFSFADANNGIALIGPEGDFNRFTRPGWGWTIMEGTVRLTHDGGERWEEIPALMTSELAPFTRTLGVAALDSSHFAMLRRQPKIEDVFVVSADGGKSWKMAHQRNDDTNRELSTQLLVHGGEYWAFGMELLHREKGGGYGVPMTLHSKDGETWTHGTIGPNEFRACNVQGCITTSGAVETLYDPREQYWVLPEGGSLSGTWAIAGNRVCTINTTIECGSALMTENQPAPRLRIPQPLGHPTKVTNLPFAPDCVACGVRVIRLDPGTNWQGRVVVTFAVDQDGSVTDLSEDGAPEGPLGALMEEQVKHWNFKPTQAGGTTPPRHFPIDVKCIDAPDVPTMDGCQLTPGKG